MRDSVLLVFLSLLTFFVVRFSKGLGVEFDPNTITPFGKAFYARRATYFVIPYFLLVILNLAISAGSVAYWSIPAVAAAQILRLFHEHLGYLDLYAATWYRPGTMYGLIASAFILLLASQSLLCMAWVIGTKWLVIRRRKEGSCPWDTSSYCMLFLWRIPFENAH